MDVFVPSQYIVFMDLPKGLLVDRAPHRTGASLIDLVPRNCAGVKTPRSCVQNSTAQCVPALWPSYQCIHGYSIGHSIGLRSANQIYSRQRGLFVLLPCRVDSAFHLGIVRTVQCSTCTAGLCASVLHGAGQYHQLSELLYHSCGLVVRKCVVSVFDNR